MLTPLPTGLAQGNLFVSEWNETGRLSKLALCADSSKLALNNP